MVRLNHQNLFATNLSSGVVAGATTSPLTSIPTIDAPFMLAFDATNINGKYEVVACTSKTATNVNHAALANDHTTAEEVRMIIPAGEMNNLGTLAEQVDGAWVSYTPTLTNLTIGNGTVLAKYTQIGKTVHYYEKITFGSTTAITGTPTTSIPVTCILSTASVDPSLGTILFRDVSVNATATGVLRVSDGNSGVISALNTATIANYVTAAGVSSTVPFTFATGDIISISGTYEAA